ncbi:outer membrane protein transport protein [bacterium]|nr:outer membrane protein transport protein [bacterium]
MRKSWMSFFILIAGAGILFSQVGDMDDSVEVPYLWGHAWPSGARAFGLAGAYTAVADAQNALMYNPAGMGQIKQTEVFATFSHMSYSSQVTARNTESEHTTAFTRLNDLGFSFPIPTYRGSLVFGFSYNRTRQFDTALFLSRFMPDRQIVGYDSVTYEFNNNTDGHLSQTSFGGSVEIGPGLYTGLAINFLGGNRDYIKKSTLIDEPYNYWYFSRFDSTDHINTTFSGLSFTMSTLYRAGDKLSFGAVIITPATMKAKENWDYLDDPIFEADVPDSTIGYYPPYYDSYSDYSEYKIRSPWIFRFGTAVKQGPVLVSGDIELIDYSQIKYITDPAFEMTSKASANILIRQRLRNVKNISAGAELDVPRMPLLIRGGVAFLENPVQNAQKDKRTVWSMGIGYRFSDQFHLDLAYGHTEWNGVTDRFVTKENITSSKFMATLNYLF